MHKVHNTKGNTTSRRQGISQLLDNYHRVVQTHLDMWIYTKCLTTRDSKMLDGVLDLKLVQGTQSITILCLIVRESVVLDGVLISSEPKVRYEGHHHARVRCARRSAWPQVIEVLINFEVPIMRGSIALDGVLDLKWSRNLLIFSKVPSQETHCAWRNVRSQVIKVLQTNKS